MSSKSKGQVLLALGVLLSLLGGFFLFGPSAPNADLGIMVRLAGVPLLFVARWLWRKGRRMVDPSWVPAKSFQLSSRKSAARQTPPVPPPP